MNEQQVSEEVTGENTTLKFKTLPGHSFLSVRIKENVVIRVRIHSFVMLIQHFK